MSEFISKVCAEHISVCQKVVDSKELLSQVQVSAEMLLRAFSAGNKLLLCGNGGSAADAQHIATEFVVRFFIDRPAINAETLTVNTSTLTAAGNDYTFDKIFSRQVEAKGKEGDILWGLTTSGTSGNIINAFSIAKQIGMKTLCFTGDTAPASLDDMCDVVLRIPSSCTPRIQECHILLGHIICEHVEKVLAEK